MEELSPSPVRNQLMVNVDSPRLNSVSSAIPS